jgi:predicted ferric reductase
VDRPCTMLTADRWSGAYWQPTIMYGSRCMHARVLRSRKMWGNQIVMFFMPLETVLWIASICIHVRHFQNVSIIHPHLTNRVP